MPHLGQYAASNKCLYLSTANIYRRSPAQTLLAQSSSIAFGHSASGYSQVTHCIGPGSLGSSGSTQNDQPHFEHTTSTVPRGLRQSVITSFLTSFASSHGGWVCFRTWWVIAIHGQILGTLDSIACQLCPTTFRAPIAQSHVS